MRSLTGLPTCGTLLTMPILEKSKLPPPVIHCVREVRVPIPVDRQAEMTHFYATLLGLAPWPQRSQIPGGVGFGHLQRGLYLQYRHDPAVDPMLRRFTIVTPSLDEVARRLDEADWPAIRRHGLDLTDEYLIVADPIGHIIVIRPMRTII